LKETRKKKTEEVLFELVPNPVISFDQNNKVVNCNQYFLDKMGYSKDDVMEMYATDFITEENKKTFHDEMLPLLIKGELVRDIDLHIKKKDGSLFHSLWSHFSIRGNDNEYRGFAAIALDLTEIDKAKDEFIAMISHDLKSPLTPIVGWCDALQDPDVLGTITPEQKKAVQTIFSSAEKLQKLIGDLLDTQKLELGRMVFEKADFQVDEMIDDLKKSFENIVKEKQIVVANSGNGKINLKSDRRKIEQVLTNLIYNAIDFVPEKTGKIEINVKNENGVVTFSVKDNGKGISKENQKNLFKRFYQVDSSLQRKHGGTGLGLSICKGIVEGLGGKIRVESEEGIGSNFYFTIPRESL